MGLSRGAAVVVAGIAAGVAGCGLGAGEESEGAATLTVTRDYGHQRLLEASVEDPAESETVIRMLDREAELTTRYGGGFVQSIEGVGGGLEDGRSLDWFFFVNGIESDRGAAEVSVRGGDRIWWDRRDWTGALRTPAVVGSWPEPFAQASAGAERLPVWVDCLGERSTCTEVVDRLADEGVATAEPLAAQRDGPKPGTLRLLVGPWRQLADEPAAAQLAGGPQQSGVFARFDESVAGEPTLTVFDERDDPAARLSRGAGLVAALREGDSPAVWIVTGTDAEGVEAAAELLDREHLADRYAVATSGTEDLPVPVVEER